MTCTCPVRNWFANDKSWIEYSKTCPTHGTLYEEGSRPTDPPKVRDDTETQEAKP